ncbi:MAG: glycoside hydrolase family 92 protein [Bacteroidota bacterium]|nr:glycoside hydrolase family 92 protein [Bacteroidota bacterium]
MISSRLFVSITLTVLLLSSGCQKKTENFIQYVNPLIGTGPSTGPASIGKYQGYDSWGLGTPAVSSPFGMTQWTPQTRDKQEKGISPYYYGGTRIQGFRGSHWLEGSDTRDYGSFTIMPITGYLRTFATERASGYIHQNEISSPAYYSCMFPEYLTFVEMTGTARAGFFRFSYVQKDQATVLITPNSDEGKGYIKVDPEKQEIYGYNPVNRIYEGSDKPAGFCGYFVARFNRPFDNYGCYFQMEDLKKQTEISDKTDIGAYAIFNVNDKDVILAKVGTSFTSIEAARANLEAEIPHWEFEKTKAETEQLWNESLSVVQLKGGKTEDYTKFYTALYHSMLFPRTFSNVDGTYPGFDENKPIRKMEEGHVYYDDFSSEGLRQSQLQLVNLVAPDRYEDLLKSLALKTEQGGWMPDSILKNSHIPYLYNNSGDPVETQKKVKNILATEYTNFDGGIPGNDDSGQTSAWYVFSAMGFYPASAGSGEYQLSSPIFSEVELNLDPKYYPGKKFTISLDDPDTYKTFNRVELNGKDSPFVLKHEDIRKGGKLKFSNTEK